MDSYYVPEVSAGSEGDGVERQDGGRSSGQGDGAISSLVPGVVWCTWMAKPSRLSNSLPYFSSFNKLYGLESHINGEMGVLPINLS